MSSKVIEAIGEERAELVRKVGEKRVMVFLDEQSGTWITNPFLSTCERFEVDPVEQYGQSFLSSDFVQLPIDELRERAK